MRKTDSWANTMSTGLAQIEFPDGLKTRLPIGDALDPKGIALNTLDLNTVTTPGTYYQNSGTPALKSKNYPIDAKAGVLKVYNWATPGSVSLIQVYYPWSADYFFIRHAYNGAFETEWAEFNTIRWSESVGRVANSRNSVTDAQQTIFADSGWRVLNAGAGLTSGKIMIRRVNRTVTVRFVDAMPNTTSNFLANAPGAGFLPANGGIDENVFVFGWVCQGASPTGIWHRVSAYRFGIQHQGLPDGSRPMPSGGLNGQMVYTTDDPWPTTLPGTVSGTIPTS